MFCLYQVTNLLNGKYYIGVHCDSANTRYMGSGISIKRAIKKYGKENFKKDILVEHEDKNFIYQLETAVVNQEFVDREDNYNIHPGGHGGSGPCSPETRQRIGARAKGNQRFLGHHHSPESLKKIGAASKGRIPWCKGKVDIFSPEHRQKIGAANARRVWSTESRQKLSTTNQGRLRKPHSAETKQKIRNAKLGKHLSLEHRQKIGAATKGKKRTAETRQRMSASAIRYWSTIAESSPSTQPA